MTYQDKNGNKISLSTITPQNERIANKYLNINWKLSVSAFLEILDESHQEQINDLIILHDNCPKDEEGFAYMPEIAQEIAVSNDMAKDLQEIGEIVIEFLEYNIWMNPSSETLTYALQCCAKLEVLEGQRYEWKNV